MKSNTPSDPNPLPHIITHHNCDPEPLEEIQKVQTYAGIAFPKALIEILKVSDEAGLKIHNCYLNSIDHWSTQGGIGGTTIEIAAVKKRHFEFTGSLMTEQIDFFHKDYPKYICKECPDLKDLVAYGNANGNGDVALLYYGPHADPVPLIWLHGSREFKMLARSFDELIDRINPEREAYYKEIDQKITKDEMKAFLQLPDIPR